MEAILKYLIDNKEWIFSGLGIFIIGGIISLIKFINNLYMNNSYRGYLVLIFKILIHLKTYDIMHQKELKDFGQKQKK